MAELRLIHQSKSARQCHVIFIHGLNGHLEDTWKHNKKDHMTLWPNWVGHDSDCSVWVLGYDAALSGWTGGAMPLIEQGTSVLDRLSSESKLKGHPLILIGHSLGGLVIKSAIVNGMTHGVQRHDTLVRQVRGVVFVATPHSGSHIANLVTALSPIKWLLHLNRPVIDLKGNSGYLSQLNHQFRAQQAALGFQVRTFLETQAVCFPRWFRWMPRIPIVTVVPSWSAEPHVPAEVAIPLAADHFSIAKPVNRSEQIHSSLLQFLSGLDDQSASHHIDRRKTTGTTLPTTLSQLPDISQSSQLTRPSKPTELAMGEFGLHPRGKTFAVTAIVVTDALSPLIQEISQWRERLARDPLAPAELKQTLREMDLRSLFAQPAVRLQLMNWLAVAPFSAYAYYAPVDALNTLRDDEILERFYVEPLVHRMSKKAETVERAWSDKSDFHALLRDASLLVQRRFSRQVPVPSVSLATRHQGGHLLELAQLVAFAVHQYLSDQSNAGDTTLFEHLRTRVRFAQNVVSGEKHERDDNPL